MEPDFKKMNGLVPAIVQDIETKQVLMLAYVNEEAYKKMMETKQTYFYSRSRQSLWHKGETSGYYQDIVGMSLDCDLDTLLIDVRQTGVACHTGSYSCFFNDIIPYDMSDLADGVYKTIIDRQKHPVDNSYTNYLLDQGIDKICKKVGEEATETVIAAKNENKEDLIGEIGDLYYHVLVLMAKKGITPKDIEKLLKKRHQISGNKKAFHTKGDY